MIKNEKILSIKTREGGILGKKKDPELERFTKNKNQKRIVIGSIIGIILLIGGILLYRSYALYEEEKEFNVLKGQIPDFGYDIKMLSVVVDGNKSKTIPERGLYKTNVECTGGKTTGSWDYNAWNLVLENVESNAKCNINFTTNGLTQEEYNKHIKAGVSLRRNTYRGKDISKYHQDGSLYTMISDGTFGDIYVGDYIIDSQNHKWLIADMDNYLNTGDTSLTKHHATIIPAMDLMNARMNATNSTEGGYYNSEMVQITLPNYLGTYVTPTFGSHVITYRNLLTNAVNVTLANRYGTDGGASNSWAWYDRQIDLMSEMNVYGSTVWSSSGFDTGIDNFQYALFQLQPDFKNSDGNGGRFSYWLKDVSSASFFAISFYHGDSDVDIAASTAVRSVRPRFLID